ncbi:MAG: class I SAM-dependent methyltransferase [Candidatus Lokiarchaeota archaeon]|nr:class I SAM-dependent methyltransferase [Candidatus Lokiarchaeota archaeon]
MEEKIWGNNSSKSSQNALEIFHHKKIKSILIPGSGYGRNSKIFSQKGYNVIGIEISVFACKLAKKFDPLTIFINASILNIPLIEGEFDAIYCFNVLHLLLEDDRIIFLKNCYNLLNSNGLAYFTVFSDMESNFRKGKKVENNTFENKPGRPAHYFSEKDLLSHFKDFSVLKMGIINEPEDHGGKAHIHKLRYTLVEKN